MDITSHGRPPTRRRRALEEMPLRANQAQHGYSPRHGDKLSPHAALTSSPQNLPHNESLVPNGTLAVRHAQPAPSPQHRRVSAVIEESRPRNPKRDSDVSNSSHASTGGRRKTHIGPWQLGKTIGKGGCSRVRIVRHSGTGQYGAAKIISKATADKVRALSLANLADSAQHDPSLVPHNKVIPFGLEREICIMKLLDHPNIVHLYDIWENRNELYLIMEYVEGGELFSYMSEHGALPEIEVVHIFRQIIAALYYCHRINIHHRDLKPENILLDRENMQIKLVDFGMAALQPQGKKLTTPCGSPHYAAPEVIAMRPYDGGTADIWSCGVILYVLLTGTPPFNYSGDDDHLKHLFRAISKADYIMPDGLSKEARDLIRKILTVNPKHRITISEIWNHAFLHKYDRELNNVGENASIGNWVGPELQLNDWEWLTPDTIDREILRYMRTLWHSEQESKLIHRLVNKECNYEKYFYSALKQYQHDQLENYTPNPYHPIAYSKSDYHHNGRYISANANAPRASPQNHVHTRTQSGYSILNNEHLYSKHSFYGPPSSEASYDPYKASKVPIIPNNNNHRNVTVHRGSSSNASQKHRPATAMGRHNSSLRIQVMKKNSRRSSAVSRKSSTRSNNSHRTASVRHGSVSRASLSSAVFPSSPPAFLVRRSSKRGVNFSRSLPYMRGSSAVTVGTAATGSAQNTPPITRYSSRGGASAISSAQSPKPSTVGESPCTRPLPKVAAKSGLRLRLRDPESPTKYITTEVKKVSTELSKVMDEAFNRRSTDSSVRASTIEVHPDGLPFESPPTSISNRDSGGTTLATPGNKSSYQNRPLPPTPTETPNTYMYRNIESLRAEMAQKFAQSGEHTEHMSLILRKLGEFEQMLRAPPEGANLALGGGLRVSSAPARSGEQPGPLHVIPEELKSDSEERLARSNPQHRAFTDPIRPIVQGRRAATEQNTIRVVDSSPARIEPLNIRKKSGASMQRGSGRNDNAMLWPDTVNVPPMSHEVQNNSHLPNPQPEPLPAPVLPVVEPKEAVIKKKKSSWFRRNADDNERTQESQLKSASVKLHVPGRFTGLDDRLKNDTPRFMDTNKQSNASDSTEFPIRNCRTAFGKTEGGGPLKGFLGLFAKKPKEGKSRRALELADNFSTSSIFQCSEAESDRDSLVQPFARDVQTNWLSRFLHIKPANKVLCFKGRRPQIRRLLLRQLRAWEHNGVKDVSYKNHVISARVDKINDLNFKAVSFVIEFFVVLQHGLDMDVCLVRFTQTAGSATGFRRAADRIEQLYRDRGLLVENEEEKAAICEMLN